MKFSSPRIEVGSVIISFRVDLKGVTPKRKYIVEKRDSEYIFIRNDEDQVTMYRSIFFMEADVIYSFLLYHTMSRLLKFEKF
jgi:hypothetical protein